MSGPVIDLSFPHAWNAEILAARPVILPTRHFVYPQNVEEVERGALEVMVRPEAPHLAFLATCALGFRDPVVPSGIWSTPNSHEICAVSGGYAYMIHTTAPQRFTMLPFRPVLGIIPAEADGLLLFVGHRTILGWGAQGEAWQSPKLSDEGIAVAGIHNGKLMGTGWNLITDKETPFVLELKTGNVING
jgi:hypothetical protein